MHILLKVSGLKGSHTVEIEDGELIEALHRIAMQFFVLGAPMFKHVTAVSCRGIPLRPQDTVLNGAIWRGTHQLISGPEPLPIDVQCNWMSEEPLGKSKLVIQRPRTLLLKNSLLSANELVDEKRYQQLQSGGLVLKQAAHQSGDRYCVALSMLLLPQVKLKIYWDSSYYPKHYKRKDENTLTMMRKRGLDIKRFYEACGVDPSRIEFLETMDVEQEVRRKKDEVFLATSDATRIVASAVRCMGFKKFQSELAVPAFTGALQDTERHRVVRIVDELISPCYDTEQPVIVIFLRNTGHAPGGAHPELDTHSTMFRQIIRFLQELPSPPHIVLVGDRIFKPYVPSKQRPSWKKGVIDMMQWWDKTLCTSGGRLSLNEQLFGFHYMHERLGDRLTLMGMRSGMLEAPACMGIQTIYLDYVFPGGTDKDPKPVLSGGFERMLVLSGNPSGGLYGEEGVQGFHGVKIPNYHVLAVHPILSNQVERAHHELLDTVDGLIPKPVIWSGGLGASPLAILKQESQAALYRKVLKLLRHASGTEGIAMTDLKAVLFWVPNAPVPKLKNVEDCLQALAPYRNVRVEHPGHLADMIQLTAYFAPKLENAQMAMMPVQLMHLASLIFRESRPMTLSANVVSGKGRLVLKL